MVTASGWQPGPDTSFDDDPVSAVKFGGVGADFEKMRHVTTIARHTTSIGMMGRRALDAVSTRFRPDRGASLVEYTLLVALIALVCFAAVTFIGDANTVPLSRAGTSLSNAN